MLDPARLQTALALLATLAMHDKQASNDQFIAALPLVEAAASDERNAALDAAAMEAALRELGARRCGGG